MKELKRESVRRLAKCDGYIFAAVLAMAVLSFATRLINRCLPNGYYLPYCLCHDLLHLYCPFCGCTRAGIALLRLDFEESIAANPFVIIFCLAFVAYNCISLVRIWRGKEPLAIKRWAVCFGVLLVLYMLVRNILMIFFGIDSLGELGVFWR